MKKNLFNVQTFLKKYKKENSIKNIIKEFIKKSQKIDDDENKFLKARRQCCEVGTPPEKLIR